MSPKFLRQSAKIKKKLGLKWRKPHGIDSAQRKHRKSRGAHPRIGYATKGKPVPTLVENMAQLEKAEGRVRLSGRLGKKKKAVLLEKAKEKKLVVVNA